MDKLRPYREIIFRPIQGIWQDVAGDSGTLADTLERYGLIIDDKCEFARFKDYEKMMSIWYRAHAQKITITLWKIVT